MKSELLPVSSIDGNVPKDLNLAAYALIPGKAFAFTKKALSSIFRANIPHPFNDLNFALGANPIPAAAGGDRQPSVEQGLHQVGPHGNC